MKAYPYGNLLLKQTNAVSVITTGSNYKIHFENDGRVPPKDIDLQLLVVGEVTAQNGATTPFGVRFTIQTSHDGANWLDAATVGEKAGTGTFNNLLADAGELMRFVRVKMVPFSANPNLPSVKANAWLMGDAAFDLQVAK